MKLLLHSCCAPCLSHPLIILQRDFEVALFYYNPNIYPPAEYEKRLKEARKFCSGNCQLIVPQYNPMEWETVIRGLEREPERGRRCYECYRLRINKTAEFAAQNGFDYFGTTLSISPHKVASWIDELGKSAEKTYGVKYFAADWKKKNGFLHSLELSKKHNLVRQDYCGCVYSMKARERARA